MGPTSRSTAIPALTSPKVQRFFPVPAGSSVVQFEALAPAYPAYVHLPKAEVHGGRDSIAHPHIL